MADDEHQHQQNMTSIRQERAEMKVMKNELAELMGGIGVGDFARSAGVIGGDLGSAQINGKFPVVDGIDYKSNSSMRTMLYMEV